MKNRRKWSDNDHYFGPFTFSSSTYKSWAVVLCSGEEDYPGCCFRITAGKYTFIVALPEIIKPQRTKVYPSWDAETVKRLGRDWYEDIVGKEYGFSYSEGFLQVFHGIQPMNGAYKRSSWFLPWTQWRHVRTSIYDLSGNLFATEPEGYKNLQDRINSYWDEVRESCPHATFSFTDFDGQPLTVKTVIEEREWKFGTGYFKWLSYFRKPMIRRVLDLRFSDETGRRKGSWKGGTTGHSIELLPGELHESGFKRYCAQHEMQFGDLVAS